jgi:diacylglycerol kinase (ATP)
MKSSIFLISNPEAKRSSKRKITLASRLLRSKGYETEIFFTTQRGDAENYAREAVKKSPSMIIAAGGDGTFNEVINGIAGTEIPMAILPLGTTNVLAKEIGIPENVESAIEVALSVPPKTVSLGRISRDSAASRYFCLMAGIGFDGEAVFGINNTIKKISGKGSYIYSGIKTLFRFNPVELTFNIDGKTFFGYSAIIGKAAKYGGNFKVTPDAKLSEPALHICLFKGRKRFDILRYVIGITTGSHLRFKDVEYVKAKIIRIDGKAHIQVDGDYLSMTPSTVEVVPDILKLIYPV